MRNGLSDTVCPGELLRRNLVDGEQRIAIAQHDLGQPTLETSASSPTGALESALDRLYKNRFPQQVLRRRHAVWKVLCSSWFSRYVPHCGRVLEVGPGYCEFINNIAASERVGVDLNPETPTHAAPGVVIHQTAAEKLTDVVPPAHFDVAFMSNFLEHCRSQDQILSVLRAVRSALKPGGHVLILGPNFRFCYKEYFDYLDHHLPLTEKAVVEALLLVGCEVEEVRPRTLPFTFRSRLPSWPWLVRLYLQLPWVWPLFGAQFFIVGKKPVTREDEAIYSDPLLTDTVSRCASEGPRSSDKVGPAYGT
jgi:SAM-dependent methyltransferase